MNVESVFSAESRARSRTHPDASRPGLERRRLQCYLAILLGDIAMLVSAFVFGGWIYQGYDGVESGLILAQLVIPVFLTIALYNNSYSLRSLQTASFGAIRALIALAISSAVVVFIAFYTKSSQDFSRFGFTLGVGLSVVMIPWFRAQMRGFVNWRCGSRVTYELLIDDEGPAIELPGTTRINARRYGLVPDSSDPVALSAPLIAY